ncbi:MAG: SGNH/GDSL hydrolase family protein [Clostridia bacterium]|nr:SGNH/GDSL hydrolase family protein [Clostridia bacterium]
MKKPVIFILLIVLFIGLFTGCKTSQLEEGAVTDVAVEGEDTPEQQEDEILASKPAETPEEEETPSEETPKEEEKPSAETPKAEQSTPKEETPVQAVPSPEEALANLYESGSAGSVLGINGKNTKAADYNVSKMVTVKAGDTVTFGPAPSAQVVQGYAFDAAGKPLQLINASVLKEEATFAYGMKIYTYTVPADAAGIKMNVHSGVKSDFVIARNHPFDLKGYQTLTGKSSEFIDDVLRDKNALFVGDSICYGSQDTAGGIRGWAQRIAADTGLNAVNNGRSGASVSDVREVTNRGGTVLTKLMEKKSQDFEYVVLHGGVNDAWDSVEVGEMEESFDPAYFNTSTFAGGLETLIYNAIVTYGDIAAIGYLINFKAPNCTNGRISDMTAYNEVAKKICDKWGITYFDMYNHQEITRELAFTTNTHTKDFIHPLPSGYDVLSPYIADYMRTMTPCSEEILIKLGV